jgi:hypothetical protein
VKSWFSTVVLSLVLFSGCAAHKPPPSLSGAGVAAWQANEALVALDTVMRSAIALNEVQVCGGTPITCHPALSEQNTRVVVQAVRSGAIILGSAPGGWPTVAVTVLDQVNYYMDENGRKTLKPYIDAARIVVQALGEGR